jgi:hypothetical protein
VKVAGSRPCVRPRLIVREIQFGRSFQKGEEFAFFIVRKVWVDNRDLVSLAYEGGWF